MNRLRFVVALTLALTGLLAWRTGLARPASTAQVATTRPTPTLLGFRPAVAIDPVPAMAWTAPDAAGSRIVAAVPADSPARPIGPAYAGDDGAPTMVSTGTGLLLVAARRDDDGSRLWSRRWESGSWRPAGPMPRAGRENHHPAVAAERTEAWVVWVSGEAASPEPGEPLFAARWDGRGWSDAEPLPPAPGEPMAPAIALDRHGRPAVVWAAGDGNDAEVWLSRRTGPGRWSAPVALSDNDVPDVQPSVARTDAGRLLVAWSTYTPVGYEVRATTERGGTFRAARTVAPAPASSPRAVAGSRGEVLWSRPRTDGGVHLQSARLRGRRSRQASDLTTLYNGRFDVALGANGAVVAAWQSPEGPRLATGSTDSNGHLWIQSAPAAPSRQVHALSSVPGGLSLPGTWRGFGDSITLGIEVDENLLETPVDGYTVPLSSHLSEFTNRSIVVINSGVGGEDTTDGLGRLAGLMVTDPKQYVLILSGANDIAVLVDTATITQNLTGMVRQVTAAGCLPLLGSLTPRREGAFLGGLNERINEINSLLPAMTTFEGALLVDTHAWLFGHPDFYSDHIHPNQMGYDALAEGWFRGIAPLLTRLIEEEDTERDIDRARLFEPRARSFHLRQ